MALAALGFALALSAVGRNRPLVPYVKNDGMLYQADLSRPRAAPRSFPDAALSPEKESLLQYSSGYVWMAYPGPAGEDGSFPLYLGKARSGRASLVSEHASDYLLLDSGKVLYTEANGALFLSDGKGTETALDEGVEQFFTDPAQENVFWTSLDAGGLRQLYTRPLNLNNERKRLARGFDSFVASPDGRSFALLEGTELWLSWRLREAERLDGRVLEAGRVLDNGTVYYERELLDSTLYYDLVDDDLLLADAAARLGTDRDTAEYAAALERDALRTELKSAAVAGRFRELCACDRNGALQSLGVGRMEDAGPETVAWLAAETREKQIRMSELYPLWARSRDMEWALFHNSLRRVRFGAAASTGYFMVPEASGGADWDLYSYPLSRGMGRADLLSEHAHSFAGISGNDIWYFADSDGESYSLCRNDELVQRSAVPEGFRLRGELACCFSGWDAAEGTGTLNFYDGRAMRPVADRVSPSGLALLPDGLCYLSGEELYIFDGTESLNAGGDILAYLSRGAAYTACLTDAGVLRAAGGPELDSGVAYVPGSVSLR